VWSMAAAGHLFENGTGIARDLAQAEHWYLRAFDAGSDYALIWLGSLYQNSNRQAEAQGIFRTGVERGFVPALFYLAWSYWNSADWSRRRDEALALLERGSAAGDLSAKRFLANAMMRGRFGLGHIPAGFRLALSVAEDISRLVEGEKPTGQSEKELRPGFFSRIAANFWLATAAKVGAAPKASDPKLLSVSS